MIGENIPNIEKCKIGNVLFYKLCLILHLKYAFDVL